MWAGLETTKNVNNNVFGLKPSYAQNQVPSPSKNSGQSRPAKGLSRKRRSPSKWGDLYGPDGLVLRSMSGVPFVPPKPAPDSVHEEPISYGWYRTHYL